MLKLKMMLCVMMLPLVVVGCTSKQSVSQCVTTASGVDNAASPDWQTPLNGIISPSERLITMQKQLEGTQKYINEQWNEVAHIDGQLSNYVSNTHALPAEYKCLK